jgi:hypothetical protein
MPPAALFLLAGAVCAAALSFIVWRRYRPARSPVRSVDQFKEALRAMSPDEPRRRR